MQKVIDNFCALSFIITLVLLSFSPFLLQNHAVQTLQNMSCITDEGSHETSLDQIDIFWFHDHEMSLEREFKVRRPRIAAGDCEIIATMNFGRKLGSVTEMTSVSTKIVMPFVSYF